MRITTLISLIAVAKEAASLQPYYRSNSTVARLSLSATASISAASASAFGVHNGNSSNDASAKTTITRGGALIIGNKNVALNDTLDSKRKNDTCASLSKDMATITSTNVYGFTTMVTSSGYIPPSSCCRACEINVDTVSIIFWGNNSGANKTAIARNTTTPTVTAAPTPVSIVSDGFTFVSPSVYVAYNNMHAHAFCDYFDNPILGKVHNTTLAYPPGALSTERCGSMRTTQIKAGAFWIPDTVTTFEAIDYKLLQAVLQSVAPESFAACVKSNFGSNTVAASPWFKLPEDLSTVDPAWATCKPYSYGAFDPPRILDPASAMGPVDPKATPFPGGRPRPAQAMPTPMADEGKTRQQPAGNSKQVDPGVSNSLADPQVPNPTAAGNPKVAIAQNDPTTPNAQNHDSVQPSHEPDQYMANLKAALTTTPTTPAPAAQEAPIPAAPVQQGKPDSNHEPYSKHVNVGENQMQQTTNSANARNLTNLVTNKPKQAANPAPPTGEINPGNPNAPSDGNTPGKADSQILSNLIASGPTESTPSGIPIVVADNTLVRAPSGGVVVAGSTLPAGIQTAISNTPISVGSEHVIVGTATHRLPPPEAIITPAAPTASPISVGDQTISKAPEGHGIVVGDSTIPPGISTVVSGTALSVGSQHVVIEGKTHTLPQPGDVGTPATPVSSPIVVADKTITPIPEGHGAVIAGSSYTPGASAMISGTPVRVDSQHVVIGGTTHELSAPAKPTVNSSVAPVLLAGERITRASSGDGVIVAGTTVTPGSAATVSNHVVSLDAGSQQIHVDNSNVYSLPSSNGEVLQTTQAPLPSVTLKNGEVLSAGGSAATVSGTVVSIPPMPSNTGANSAGKENGLIVVNGKTMPLPQTSSPVTNVPQVIEAGGSRFTPTLTSNNAIIGSDTLTANGAAMTLSGTTMSLGSSGILKVGSTTLTLTSSPKNQAVTAGGQTFHPVFTSNEAILGSKTLTANEAAMTISGTVVSLDSSGILQVGGSTLALTSPTSTASSLGGSIMPAFSSLGNASSNPTESGSTTAGVPSAGSNSPSPSAASATMRLVPPLTLCMSAIFILLIAAHRW